MPCYFIVTVQLQDEALARKALDALGIDGSRLRRTTQGWAVDTYNRDEERAVRTEYAKQFSLEQATRNLYTLRSEEDEGDTLTLRFTRY